MKLIFLCSEIVFDITNNDLNLLIVENSQLFEKINNELYTLSDKGNDEIYLLSDGEKISLNKVAKWIHSPYAVDISKRETQKQLFRDIITQVDNDDSIAKIVEHLNIITNELETISLRSGFQLEYKNDTEIEGILKLLDVQISNETDSFLERTIDFIHSYNSLLGIDYFIISNCIGYLDEKDLIELKKYAQYLQVTIILVDYSQKYSNIDCNIQIIDQDLCEIH